MIDLFASRVDSTGRQHPALADYIDASGSCWLWTSRTNSKGYGIVKSKAAGTTLAHRVIWIALVGSIPADVELDHLCRVKNCVNPDHLEPVSRAENARRSRGFRPRVYKCPQGHNIHVVGRNSGRACNECSRIKSRDYQRRLRAKQ